MGFQLLLHELVQHFLRKKRLLVAKGLPDEDQGGNGLPPGVKPEGIQGVQRLLGRLVQGQMEQETAIVLTAALVGELVVRAVLVQPVEAVVQRQVGAEFGKAAGAILAAAGIFPPGEQKTMQPRAAASRMSENTTFMGPSADFESCFPYCNTTCGKLCYNI